MIGGAVGAVSRYQLDLVVSQRIDSRFPWGIFLVNITGAFVVGLLFAMFESRTTVDPTLRVALTTGFLGAYTTFSTLMLDTARLSEAGELMGAAANLVGSMVVGMAAVALGMGLGRAL